MAEGQAVSSPPELRPNPDPTDRTIEQIRRENISLREIIETRLDGYDKAIALLQAAVDREPKPPVLESDIAHLGEMMNVRFSHIETRFSDRDKRNEQTTASNQTLVTNTIEAMREAFLEQNKTSQQAIGKSEAATQKQMDQIEGKFGTEIRALHGNITDIKDDITRLKSLKEGSKETKEDLKAVWAIAAGAVALLVSITSVVYTVNRPAPVVQVVPAAPAPPAPAGQITQ